jgi:hypothetical protein
MPIVLNNRKQAVAMVLNHFAVRDPAPAGLNSKTGNSLRHGPTSAKGTQTAA